MRDFYSRFYKKTGHSMPCLSYTVHLTLYILTPYTESKNIFDIFSVADATPELLAAFAAQVSR